MPTTRRAALAGLAALAAPGILHAQDAAYPTRPIRLLVGFSGGGSTDISARVVAGGLAARLGQPCVVDNRPGAGGNVAQEIAAHAEPDGYTLVFTPIGALSINQFLYPRLPYDPETDFASISLTNTVANGIFVGPEVQAGTLEQLLALARRDPGGLNYGTPGNGTSGHLSGEYLKTRTGVNLQHVPYRGSAQVIPDLLAGRTQVAIDNLPPYLPYVAEGRLRLLAVTSAERWFAVPAVPTVAESGVPGFAAVAWWGVQAPARTPLPILATLAEATRAVVRDPVAAGQLRAVGSQPVGSTPAEFDRFILAERAKWGEVVRVSGMRLD